MLRRSIIFLVMAMMGFAAMPVDAAGLAPDWALKTPEGETVRLSEEAPKQVTVMFFWATWCPFCKALMPHLQSIKLEHGDDVKILAINFREDGDPVGFIRERAYNFTVLPDGDEVAKAYDIWGTPGLVIVDKDRRVHFDLRQLQIARPPNLPKSNSGKAAYLAPIWAAEIRTAIDELL